MWTTKDIDRFFVGFDPLMKQIADTAQACTKAANYPPYNIKKTAENKYVIELAVAGFSRNDLEVELEDSKLVIRGNIEKDDEQAEWPQTLFSGLAFRPFTRTFTLADNVEIKSSELANGLLKIWLEAITPESKKVKIDIQDGAE